MPRGQSGGDLTEFLVKADIVAHDIAAGRFYKPPGKWCGYCYYLALCLKDEKKDEKTLVKIPYSK